MPFLRILKNGALMAAAQSLSIVSQIVRSKLIAETLGAQGIGMLGIMNSFAGNVSSVSGWGLSTSAARLMAADAQQKPLIAGAVIKLGRWLSIAGVALAVLTCLPMSQVTFGSGNLALELALSGLAAPFLVASGVFAAILQVEGDVRSIALAQSVGVLAGLAIGLLVIFLAGTPGIAIAIIAAAAMPAMFLWFRARPLIKAYRSDFRRDDIMRLLRMGGAMMMVGWLAQLSAYLVRLIIIKQTGLESSGYYQAAFSIASTAPLFVLAAMGNEYFPRIAAARDEQEAREAAEHQVRAALLIGLPFIVAIVCLGRMSLRILYSQEFEPATGLLSWMGWGALCRLVSWPFGYWLLARGTGRQMVILELIANASSVLVPLLLIPIYGVEGAAIGFCVSSLLYLLIMAYVVRQRSGEWPAARVWNAFFLSAVALGLSQMSLAGSKGYFMGIAPVLAITALCAYIYRLCIKETASAE
jgi:PST family polysaccharide transporter